MKVSTRKPTAIEVAFHQSMHPTNGVHPIASKFKRTIMKKMYFTKYLPIEGEPKLGDTCSCPHKGQGIDVGRGKPNPVQVIFTYTKHRNLCKDCYKVALFLCSRDISFDDDLYYPEGIEDKVWDEYSRYSGGDETNENWFDANIKWIGSLGVVKKIGQISSEATWVKEGMEFEEDNLEVFMKHHKFPDESHYLDSVADLLLWKSLNPNPVVLRPIIKIKCSQCNTFH